MPRAHLLRPSRAGVLRMAALFGLFASLALTKPVAAQDDEDPGTDPGTEEPEQPPPAVVLKANMAGSAPMPADFSGSLQIVRGPANVGGPVAGTAPEIFPEASRVWMSVTNTDPVPIETARRGGPWLCSSGQCSTTLGENGQSKIGDDMLRSIKLQTPTLPLPLTLWGRLDEQGKRTLDFDPMLLTRKSYTNVCSYKPIEPSELKGGPRKVEKAPICRDDPPPEQSSDSGELFLGMQWPKQSEMADFRYIAIVDSCGNARVQPFQRTFTVPVREVASGGCDKVDGKVLKVFPSGSWLRVTAFNLEAAAAGPVVNVTYRVTIPPLENLVESNPARMLFPDPQLEDLKVDCGPAIRRAPVGPDVLPMPAGVKPMSAPPPAAPPAAPPSEKAGLAGGKPGDKPTTKPGDKPTASAKVEVKITPPAVAPKPMPMPMGPPKAVPSKAPTGPGPQPLAHMSLVIAPEPLRQGLCRIRFAPKARGRLVAPLALYVSLTRTDRTSNGAPIELLNTHEWIVTPNSTEFQLPPLAENFDGDSRLRLAVYSDPMSADGKVVLVSDAARVASSLRSGDTSPNESARRLIGSATIHSVPLCGESNFETLDAAGSCLRAYLTIPAMLATLQITRAPWLERPLVTRSVLSAVGVALAIDSYDPVRRRAFPIAGQIGGSIQQLGDGRVGLLGYLGIAPTVPVLGEGGNTTSFGFLAGLGMSYITNETGPDEGFKPAAFLSVVVQVGQATPTVSAAGNASVFGTYQSGQ